MSNLFHEIPDAQVILKRKGVYRQVKLFQRCQRVYAQYGTGFIGLFQDSEGCTTVPDIRWVDLHSPQVVFVKGHLGLMEIAPTT